jgi:hypothetical protein
MKVFEKVFSPWKKEEAKFISKKMADATSLRFETTFVNDKVQEDGRNTCTVFLKLWDGSTEMGKFIVDGTILSTVVDGKTHLPEKGICDIKDGVITNVKGE